jgi:hypothetical protein
LDCEEQLLESLPADVGRLVRQYLDEPLRSADNLRQEMRSYLASVEELASHQEFIDTGLARLIARQCEELLDAFDARDPECRLIQAAVRYFIEEDDAEGDTSSPIGFDDDARVVNEVARILGLEGREAAD